MTGAPLHVIFTVLDIASLHESHDEDESKSNRYKVCTARGRLAAAIAPPVTPLTCHHAKGVAHDPQRAGDAIYGCHAAHMMSA